MIDQIIEILKSIEGDKKFFGSVTFKFENGKLVYIKEERGYKPTKENVKQAIP